VPDPVRGAIRGVGPLLPVELDVVVVPARVDEVVLGAGGLGGGGLAETVRTARIGVVEADDDGFATAAWDVVVRRCARAFAVVARLADVRARGVEFLAVGLLAVATTEPACSATAFGAARGKPCTIATAAPTASAPPRAPIVAHDSESRRRGSDGASQRRAARGKPSSAAQNATPP
jgi:hypothetical protein